MKHNLKMMLNILIAISFYSCAICSIMFFDGQSNLKNIITFSISFLLFILTLFVKNQRIHLKILVNFIYLYIICDVFNFLISLKTTSLIEKCLMLAVITVTLILNKYLKRESKLY